MFRLRLACLCASLFVSSVASAQDTAGERATSLRAPEAGANDLHELETAQESPALSAIAEVGIGTTPTFGFGLGAVGSAGALASADGFGIGGRTDFAFAASARLFFGFGLNAIHHAIARTAAAGAETANRVSIPLIAQLYLDTPRRRAAVPTLRITPALRWANQTRETFDGVTFTRNRSASLGGQVEVGIGITWFVLDALAIRCLGDIGFSADFATSGPKGNDLRAYVGADIGVVIRL